MRFLGVSFLPKVERQFKSLSAITSFIRVFQCLFFQEVMSFAAPPVISPQPSKQQACDLNLVNTPFLTMKELKKHYIMVYI